MVGDKVAVADTRRRQAPLIETSRSLADKQREPERKRERERDGERKKQKRRSRREQFRLRGSSLCRSLLFVRTAERRSRPFASRQVV